MAETDLSLTNTSESGLTAGQVQERRSKGLGNPPQPPTGRTYWQIIRENVFTFINILLFGLGIALVLVGRPKDALVSILVISLNILVSVIQEIRAKRKLDQIALLTRPKAAVVRDGKPEAVTPEELVVGDVLKVGPGDQILLDGRVIGSGRIMVDESLLTGESDLVAKKMGDPVYSGSFCASGAGLVVVEKVGDQSLANKITAGARVFRRVYTPLQQNINLTLRIMLLVAGYLELLQAIDAIVNHTDLGQSISNSTIIAGLVPNGLFLSISVAYALGAVRMIRSGALVQQANAIESLSNVDVLCTDKTGTLTTNDLVVEAVIPLLGEAVAVGAGVGAAAGPGQDDPNGLEHILGVMAASATGGNKTSEAIARAFPAQACKPAAEVPFSSDIKWSALAFDGCEDGTQAMKGVYVLGAPEMLKPALAGDGYPEEQIEAFASRGLRVLLAARAPDPGSLPGGDSPALPRDLQPLGLVALSQELRPEAKNTLENFRKTRVTVKILSGDNPDTVAALARQAGLGPEIRTVSGAELEKMSTEEFNAAVEKDNIFGRIKPQQKEQLIEALRGHGHYVAMMGDGVNDVLGLKKADLAISVQSGSQATRAVSDLVLLNDSFAAIASAVEEGQRIVNGMQDIIKLFLSRILSMVLLIVSAMVIGQFPLAVRQVSLITFFAVAIPSMMLAVWAHPGQVSSLGARLARFVIPPVMVTAVVGLILFFSMVYLSHLPVNAKYPAFQVEAAEPYQVAQSALAVFMTIVGLLQIVFVEPPTRWWTGGDPLSGDWRPTLLAGALFAATGVVLAIPTMRNFFDLRALDVEDLGMVALASVVWLFVTRWLWRTRLLERFLGIRFQKMA